MSKLGARNWSLIAKAIPGRSGKSCRLRWVGREIRATTEKSGLGRPEHPRPAVQQASCFWQPPLSCLRSTQVHHRLGTAFLPLTMRGTALLSARAAGTSPAGHISLHVWLQTDLSGAPAPTRPDEGGWSVGWGAITHLPAQHPPATNQQGRCGSFPSDCMGLLTSGSSSSAQATRTVSVRGCGWAFCAPTISTQPEPCHAPVACLLSRAVVPCWPACLSHLCPPSAAGG